MVVLKHEVNIYKKKTTDPKNLSLSHTHTHTLSLPAPGPARVVTLHVVEHGVGQGENGGARDDARRGCGHRTERGPHGGGGDSRPCIRKHAVIVARVGDGVEGGGGGDAHGGRGACRGREGAGGAGGGGEGVLAAVGGSCGLGVCVRASYTASLPTAERITGRRIYLLTRAQDDGREERPPQ